MNYKTALIAGGAALVSGAAGVIAGYKLAYHKLTDTFDAELKSQLDAAEQVFMMKHKVGMYRSPISMVESVVPVEGQTEEQVTAHRVAYDTRSTVTDQDLGKIIESLRKPEPNGRPGNPIVGPAKSGSRPVVTKEAPLLGLHDDDDDDALSIQNHNVFSDSDSEQPNYSEYLEENPRTKEAPYIITVTEYSVGEEGYDQATLVWYDEDGVEGLGVLADLKDIPIEDVDRVVGEANMEKFGMWSGAENTVYIRNERLRTDFEVARNRGSYAAAVGLRVKPRTKRTPTRRGADE